MKKSPIHIDLNNIKDPSFLKQMDYDDLATLSDDIASYLVDITSTNGGHLSSNLGVVDATIALCRSFDFNKDKIIFDVGHQSYTYKLLTGRDLTSLRKKDGVSGFQKMHESPYDHYEAGHSSTSISAALGMATARDLNKEDYNIIAFIGDSSISNGLSFEGLNSYHDSKHKIIIVVNDNEMSISRPVGGFSHLLRKFQVSAFYNRSKNLFIKLTSKGKLGEKIYKLFYKIKNGIKKRFLSMTLFDNLGYSVIGVVDGHDIKAMEKAFNKAKHNSKSAIIIIKTIKGKGYKYAQEDKTGKWHGVGPFNKQTGEMVNSDVYTWSHYYSELIDKKLREDDKVVVITPGTGYGSEVYKLTNYYPTRCIDVGIAEEHAFTYASGLAVSGYHPVIAIYSTFLQRAYDELSHDIARMNLDVTILVDRAGLVGSDGETHQGLYDVAFLNSIPNVTICMPSNDYEAKMSYEESFKHHGPFIIRFPKEKVVNNPLTYPVEYGKWVEINRGENIAIIAVGPIINDIKNIIEKEKLPIGLYNALYIKPLDEEMLNFVKQHYQKIIIYDVYSTENGLSQIIKSKLSSLIYKGEIITLAVPDKFIPQASILEQREDLNVSLEDLFKVIK
mgnify:CR=1 FL=1